VGIGFLIIIEDRTLDVLTENARASGIIDQKGFGAKVLNLEH